MTRTGIHDIPIPSRMLRLDRDPRGYPIPVGVYRDADNKPHFTINDEAKRITLLVNDRCPICGDKLFRGRWFVGGPGSAFHEHGAYIDLPGHHECVTYSLKVCPYLAAPNYNKRIDGKTLGADDNHTLALFDPTVIPERPELFVAVMSIGTEIVAGGQYVRPRKPYLRVEYWRGGQQVSAPAPALEES